MGAGDRVVGVTRFCDYPPEVAPIPKVGGLTDANLEAIVALRPDLVIGVRSRSAQDLGRRLDSAKLAWVMLPVETLEDVRLSVRTLGRIVGQSDRAEEIARRLPKPASSEPTGPTVLLAFGRKPLIAAGPGTFGDQLIRAAGGRNALDGNDNPYPTIDRETLLELQPQVVLDTSATVAEPWPAELEAVKRERVHTLDPALLRPGPRLDDALARISAAISAAGDGP